MNPFLGDLVLDTKSDWPDLISLRVDIQILKKFNNQTEKSGIKSIQMQLSLKQIKASTLY